MTFRNHVFISYAHADNKAAAGKPGWVTVFQEVLEPYLEMRMARKKPKIWRDKRLSDNDDFDPIIMKEIPSSAVFLAVITDNYVGSKWCIREAKAFCELAAFSTVGLKPADKHRAFKVVLLPPKNMDPLPGPLSSEALGREFYLRLDKESRPSRDEHDIPYPLDPSLGTIFDEMLRQQVTALAYHISQTLEAIDNPTEQPANDKSIVYLATCCPDRAADREILRSELVTQGYEVLPDHDLPDIEAAMRADVAQMLERSKLSVHLFGSQAGKVLDDTAGDESVLVIQHKLAVARSTVGPLKCLVSLPRGTMCARAAHQTFLDGLVTDDAGSAISGNTDLIDGDVQKVKEELLAQLRQLDAVSVSPAASALPLGATRDARHMKIYVIYDSSERLAAGELCDALEDHFGKVLQPVFGGTPEENRKKHESKLVDADAVLFFYGAGNDNWLDSMASETEKALARRDGRAFAAVLTWVTGPPNDDKLNLLRKPRPHVINALRGFDPALLSRILNTLNGGAHS